ADGLPPGPAGDGVGVDGLAAPRREDDLGIAARDLRRIHHAPAGRTLLTKLGEHVPAARELDRLRDPADARDQRIHPFLEIHPRTVGPHTRVLPDLPDLVAHVLDEVAGLTLAPQRATDQEDGLQNLVDRS